MKKEIIGGILGLLGIFAIVLYNWLMSKQADLVLTSILLFVSISLVARSYDLSVRK